MRTARSFTNCTSWYLAAGGPWHTCPPATHAPRHACPQPCIPLGTHTPWACTPGHACPLGMHAPCPQACTPLGMHAPLGMHVPPRHACLPATHAPPPLVNRMKTGVKILACPKLRLRAVIMIKIQRVKNFTLVVRIPSCSHCIPVTCIDLPLRCLPLVPGTIRTNNNVKYFSHTGPCIPSCVLDFLWTTSRELSPRQTYKIFLCSHILLMSAHVHWIRFLKTSCPSYSYQ